jgi:arginase
MTAEQVLDALAASRARVVSIGLPTYRNSSCLRATSDAPAIIAGEMHREEGNSFTECGIDLQEEGSYAHAGDLDLEQPDDFARIASLAGSLGRERHAIFFGGDHSVTWPILHGLARVHGSLDVVHIDAHPDLYDDYEGNPHSHASPFARIMEQGLARSLEQYGIRTLTPHQRAQVQRFGVRCHEMKDHRDWPVPAASGPVYVSIDLDGLDPACAPGVAHREPGGMSVRDALDVLFSIRARIVGADIVEYHPARDVSGITALAAAKLAREIAGMMLQPHA